jgi:hypothetical protein
MSRTRVMLTAMMMTSLAGLAATKEAHAFLVTSPYDDQGVSVTVGHDPRFGPIVCYQLNTSGSTFTVYSLGTTAGLNDDYMIASGNGNDFLKTINSTGTSACGGYIFNSLVYNTHRLDMRGSGGNDTIVCGFGKSDCFGDTGDDHMQAFSPTGRISGAGGKDALLGTSAVATDRMSGGTGADCLEDPGDQHAEFDCGADADTFVLPGSNRISCETNVPHCI